MNGVINVLKPTGMSSHDIVNYIRRLTGIKKVGHAGTLDPNVSGVLPICIGKGTKLSDILINGDKEYICEIIFGSITDTDDMYGNIVEESTEIVSNELIEEAILSFKGEIMQIPPAYSAVKVNGKKLYEYARDNIIVEKAERKVEIKELEILKINFPRAIIKVKCSKGTYMRVLCKDIGRKLNICAHMGILIRTNAKGLGIDSAYSLEELKFLSDNNEFEKCVIPFDVIVPLEKVYVDDRFYNKLIVGNEIKYKVNINNIWENKEFYVYCMDKLLGIGHMINRETIKIDTMLI